MTYSERMTRLREQRAYTRRCRLFGLPAIIAPYTTTTIPEQRRPTS